MFFINYPEKVKKLSGALINLILENAGKFLGKDTNDLLQIQTSQDILDWNSRMLRMDRITKTILRLYPDKVDGAVFCEFYNNFLKVQSAIALSVVKNFISLRYDYAKLAPDIRKVVVNLSEEETLKFLVKADALDLKSDQRIKDLIKKIEQRILTFTPKKIIEFLAGAWIDSDMTQMYNAMHEILDPELLEISDPELKKKQKYSYGEKWKWGEHFTMQAFKMRFTEGMFLHTGFASSITEMEADKKNSSDNLKKRERKKNHILGMLSPENFKACFEILFEKNVVFKTRDMLKTDAEFNNDMACVLQGLFKNMIKRGIDQERFSNEEIQGFITKAKKEVKDMISRDPKKPSYMEAWLKACSAKSFTFIRSKKMKEKEAPSNGEQVIPASLKKIEEEEKQN